MSQKRRIRREERENEWTSKASLASVEWGDSTSDASEMLAWRHYPIIFPPPHYTSMNQTGVLNSKVIQSTGGQSTGGRDFIVDI